MGWKSAMDITPDDARKVILLKVLEASPDELRGMLNLLLESSPYNFRIVYSYSERTEAEAEGWLEFKTFRGTL